MKIKQLRLFLFSGGTFAGRQAREQKRERERETDVIEGRFFCVVIIIYIHAYRFSTRIYESYFYIFAASQPVACAFSFSLALLLRLQIALLALLVFSGLSFILGIVHAPPV